MKEWCGKMKSIVCTFFVVLIFITVPKLASAEEFNTYVGFGIGESSYEIFSSDADKLEDTDTSFKIFGGVDLNPNLAAEFGFINFGEFSAEYSEPLIPYDETDKAHGAAFFATVKGQANITEQLALFAKLGFDIWYVNFEADGSFSGTPFSGSGNGAGLNILYGVGINLKVTDQVSIRAEWEQYKNVGDGVDVDFPGAGTAEVDGEDIDVLGVALSYHF